MLLNILNSLMNKSAENTGKNIAAQSEKVGESMKDSMSESPENNDNTLLPGVDAVTNEKGELDPEVFKEIYQKPRKTGPGNNINPTYKK